MRRYSAGGVTPWMARPVSIRTPTPASRGTGRARATYGIVGGMEKTTVYLSTDQKRALARAARAEGRSEAELIREGIDSITARHRTGEPTLPLFDSNQPDLATHADELMRGFGED